MSDPAFPSSSVPYAAVLASFLAVSVVACGDAAKGPAAPNAAEVERRAVDHELGTSAWRLESYRPQIGADALTMGLVALQVQKLDVRFDGTWMRASSPTMTFEAPYVVKDAGGGVFTLETRHNGLVYTSRCQFTDGGRRIQFQAQTSPWQGEGSVARVP
ncbi:MAG: hypothetical protein U0169_19350 [Polyangiaceae bacterium]